MDKSDLYAAHAILADYIIFEFIPSYLSFGCSVDIVVALAVLLCSEQHQKKSVWQASAAEVAALYTVLACMHLSRTQNRAEQHTDTAKERERVKKRKKSWEPAKNQPTEEKR